MERSKPLERRTALRSDPAKARAFEQRGRVASASRSKPRAISPASPEQRRHIAGRPCLIPGCNGAPVDPAHVIPRGMLTDGQDLPQAVIPLCRFHHGAYDRHELDLLPFQSLFREEIGFAVYRMDLISVIERLSGERWCPAGKRAA